MMKEEILKRAMFSMPLSKAARNSGIMEGFEDEEIEDLENQNYEDMPPMARSPQNPEILMNTLRGDMRSVDARYMELAQMVGEEAAYETPPEVLAMLQPQLAQQQQGGIGALPQAANMMPPGMMPPEMAPQGMPPEGGIAPFSQGGAEQAPPTPDGLPPMRAAVGAFVTPLTRAAQYLGDKASSLGSMGTAANAAAGRFLSQGFPQTFRPVFENVRGPGGRFTAEQTISYPTLTQHMANLAGPRATALAGRFAPGSSAAVGGIGGLGVAGLMRDGAPQADLERAQLLKAYEQMYYQDKDRSIPMPFLSDRTNEQLIQDLQGMERVQSSQAARTGLGGPRPGAPGPAAVAPEASRDEMGDFIKQVLARDAAKEEAALPQAFGEAAARPKPLTRAERTKKEYEELAPLYKEILGEDKESAKVNALLLLADAGLKFAGSRQRSVGMALAEAASGLPRGFAAIAAQAKEQEGKIKAAALSQAINTISEQDKYAQAELLEQIKGRNRIQAELVKKLGESNVITENVGLGVRIQKTKDGSHIGAKYDPDDPAFKAALGTNEAPNRFTLKDTDNPFVVNRGPSPTPLASTPEEFKKISASLLSINNSLQALEEAESIVQNLYGPGAFFVDKYNKFIVPMTGGLAPPSVELEKASTAMGRVVSGLSKGIAAANNDGRVSVQQEKWARDIYDGLINPVGFLSNPEIAAAGIQSQKTQLLNARMALLNQAGLVRDEYVMRTPNLGTPSDPFVYPTDPDQQKIMDTWLRNTIGKVRSPDAGVYIRMPNGNVIKASPADILQGR
jgi:hypothetical protein